MLRKFLFVSICLSLVIPVAGDDHGLELSEGLTISLVADDNLVPDCTNLAVSPTGQLAVSGRGYIRLLKDVDGDAKYDESIDLARVGHGAHGLCFDQDALYFVADGGIWKIIDTDGDGIVDSDPAKLLSIKTGGEHDAHAIRRGADGFWYLIAGNGTKGSFDLQNVSDPLLKNPRAGAIWRISPDWSKREIWAHGFRNAFDFDFAPGDAIDTFDSDGERDVSLPWYQPTRVFRVRRGDDAGWVTRSWKRAQTDPLMPELMAKLGRGSPTGVLRYRHKRLPDRFHQGVFVSDWTFGRIVFIGDDRQVEIVAEPSGTTGFAVTDIDSFPDGRLAISVGGRGSRGGVYLLDSKKPPAKATLPSRTGTETLGGWRGDVANDRDRIGHAIAELRDHDELRVSEASAERAISALDRSREQPFAALTLLIESVGGLGAADPKDARGKEQVAAVFDGYRTRLRPKLSKALVEQATAVLLEMLRSDCSELIKRECVRALAILEPESADVFAAIADDLERVASPTEKLHRLIALARIPVSRDDDMTDRTARAMLQIPRLVDQRGWNVERHWPERLGELYEALHRRDSLLASRLVSQPSFGQASDLVWTVRMDPENLERARRLFLDRSDQATIDPRVARFVALGDDAVPRRFTRRWLDDSATRPAALLAIASHANRSDEALLLEAALSVDKQVQQAAQKALDRLGIPRPEPPAGSPDIRQWIRRAETVVAKPGIAERGKPLFHSQQCAQCHVGGKALGPSLEGIGKRFGTSDLLRATFDPGQVIADRYRARRVLTVDGEVVIGMKIYESADGLTLMTATGNTVRINADQIVQTRPAETSLMPAGLIDNLSDQQIADLIAYLRTL